MRSKTGFVALACACALGSACTGSIGNEKQAGAGRGGRGGEQGGGTGGDGEVGGSGSSGAAGSTPDPNNTSAAMPRFACDSPSERGKGQLAMRRLTRDELMQSLSAVIGDDVMQAAAVQSAAAQIPAEAPGDLVASFQNGHAFDHVEGLLITSQAVAAEIAASAAVQERVLGACAAEADRACAGAFLEDVALRLMRRPLDSARRAALLDAFEAEGAGAVGMQWLLARVLQAPETIFHLELSRQDCEEAAPADDATFAWDDESVFFSPYTGGELEPRAEIAENGWYVWQIPGARMASSATTLRIELESVSGDGVPLELDVNLNDTALVSGLSFAPGEHTIEADVVIAAGAAAKVGVSFKNAAAGRSLALRALTLSGGQSEVTCSDVAGSGGVYSVDAWSVASRLAYALTGEGPDAALLEAAARDELKTEVEARAHAERLIETPAARRQLDAVLTAWLNLNAIPKPHEVVAERAGITTEGLVDEARQELLDYVGYQVLEQETDMTALMQDAIGFPRSERMATLYGSEIASGAAPVDLPKGHGGMLLRAAPLFSGQLSSSPILRGVYVRKRILCDVLQSPDFSIVNSRLEELDMQDRTKISTREAVTEITSVGACPGCHVHINALGFPLERFDPLGMPRDEEIVFDQEGSELARHPIDTHVTEANIEPGLPSELEGAEDLNAALADSAKVRACIAERLYTHARLRPKAEPDYCALAEIEEGLREGGTVKEAWLRAVVNRELFIRQENAP